MFVFYKYFRNNIWLNFLSGIPSPGLPDELSKYNVFMRINMAVSLVVHMYTFVACSAVVIKFRDAKDISQQVARLGMDSEVFVYTLYYLYNHKKLVAIINKIEELISDLQTDPLTRNKDVMKAIDSEYVRLKYYTTIAFGIVSTLPTLYAIPRLARYYGLIDPNGKVYAYQVTYDASYTPVYEITLFLQIGGLTYATLKHLASESFFLAMLALLAALYKYLGAIFVDVFKSDEEYEKATMVVIAANDALNGHTDAAWTDCDRVEKYTLNNNKIKTWIKFHQQVIWIGNSLVRFYAPVLLVYFFLLYAQVISMIMTLTTTKNMYSKEDKTIILVYWIIMLIDLLVLCTFGAKLVNESLNVTDHGFSSTWYNCSPQVKSTTKIIFARVRKTLRPAALGLFSFHLSHESFVTIVKSMASFYIALVEIKQRNQQQQQLEQQQSTF